jgi:hypothetical protein
VADLIVKRCFFGHRREVEQLEALFAQVVR